MNLPREFEDLPLSATPVEDLYLVFLWVGSPTQIPATNLTLNPGDELWLTGILDDRVFVKQIDTHSTGRYIGPCSIEDIVPYNCSFEDLFLALMQDGFR